MIILKEIDVDIWDIWDHMNEEEQVDFRDSVRVHEVDVNEEVLDLVTRLRKLGYTVEPPVEVEF